MGLQKERGLELMQREDEMVAFIPAADRAVSARERNPRKIFLGRCSARPLYLHLPSTAPAAELLVLDLGWADGR